MRPGYSTNINDINQLSPSEKKELQKVGEKYRYLANEYYLSLIDWDDPDDPIRRIIIPDPEELQDWGILDASDEGRYTVLPGLQHKYRSTAVMLISNACGGVCRYCFRKRIFIRSHMEVLKDVSGAIKYLREHREINNVLLTGGDPLRLETERLEEIVREVRAVDHVRLIRIGTKMLSYNPYRVLDDPSLSEMIRRHSRLDKKIYVMTHFTHPREMTTEALKAIQTLQDAGAILTNQTPLLRGVNDTPEVLSELLNELSFAGVPPYYVFQCRPASGNKPYSVPIEEGYTIFEDAKSRVSGLAKRARYVMSHSTGKIQVVGKTSDFTYFKYLRAAKEVDSGRFMVMRSNPDAYWFDDYEEEVGDQVLKPVALLA